MEVNNSFPQIILVIKLYITKKKKITHAWENARNEKPHIITN